MKELASNERIKARRLSLRLADVEVAQKSGLSIHEYCDIEKLKDEILTVTPLSDVKRLCETLNLSVFEILGIECDYCTRRSKVDNGARLTRERLIRMAREEVGLSEFDLGEQLGFEPEAIHEMEQDPKFLENWPIVHISNLAMAIDVPLQDLLAVSCETCKN